MAALVAVETAMKFLQDPPRYHVFTGKRGVGKTSVARATALELAGRGKHVLLPASAIAGITEGLSGS